MNGPTLAAGAFEILERLRRDAGSWCQKLLSGDVHHETIHQARVSTRRFRSALRAFRELLPGRQRRSMGRASRRLARGLGEVRDGDVLLEHVCELRPSRNAARAAALRFLRNRLRMSRADTMPAACEEAARFLQGEGAPGTGAGPWRIRRKAAEASERQLRGHAAWVLSAALAELLSYQKRVCKDHDVAASHRMRIAAKHLRYGLEMFAGVLGAAEAPRAGGGASTAAPAVDGAVIAAALKAATRVQGMLGHVHDHQVWGDWLTELRREVRRMLGDEVLASSLAAMAAEERRRRDLEMRGFIAWWERACGRGTFERFLGQLRTTESL